MTAVRFVRAGQDDVDDAETAAGPDALIRHALAGAYGPACGGRVFERAHDRRPDRYDPPPSPFRPANGRRRHLGNTVRLRERQAAVECGIASGRDAGRERDRREPDTAFAHRADRVPVEREARRWRLKGDRQTGDGRPHVPQCEGRRNVRVLNRPAVTREAGPDGVGRSVEAKQDETRMVEKSLDRRRQPFDVAQGGPFDVAQGRPQLQAIAGRERWRRRTILGPRAEVSLAEDDGREGVDVLGGQRCASGKADFDLCAGRLMHAAEARGQRRRIVGDHQVAWAQKLDEPRPTGVRDAALRVDDEQPRVARPLNRQVRCDHKRTSLNAVDTSR